MLTLMDSSMIMDSTLEHVEQDDPVKREVIDVDKIKRILDTKYNEAPKRKSIRLEETVDVA